jgi:hypothetical protein
MTDADDAHRLGYPVAEIIGNRRIDAGEFALFERDGDHHRQHRFVHRLGLGAGRGVCPFTMMFEQQRAILPDQKGGGAGSLGQHHGRREALIVAAGGRKRERGGRGGQGGERGKPVHIERQPADRCRAQALGHYGVIRGSGGGEQQGEDDKRCGRANMRAQQWFCACAQHLPLTPHDRLFTLDGQGFSSGLSRTGVHDSRFRSGFSA